MASFNNSIPQLPSSSHTGSSAVINYDNYDRSLLSDIDPDLNYATILLLTLNTIMSSNLTKKLVTIQIFR